MNRLDWLMTEIRQASEEYQPASDMEEYLRNTVFIPLIGPFAVGKTTVMQEVSSQNSNFNRIKSFTTRQSRPEESLDTYDFLNHDEQTLSNLKSQIANRELVQFTVHPTTERIYGSFIQDYSHPYSMLDTMPGALTNSIPLPFKEIRGFAIVASQEEWLARAYHRLETGGKDDFLKRTREGSVGLEWALDQNDALTWINNSGRDVTSTASELVNVAKDERPPDVHARKIGYTLLKALRELQESLA